MPSEESILLTHSFLSSFPFSTAIVEYRRAVHTCYGGFSIVLAHLLQLKSICIQEVSQTEGFALLHLLRELLDLLVVHAAHFLLLLLLLWGLQLIKLLGQLLQLLVCLLHLLYLLYFRGLLAKIPGRLLTILRQMILTLRVILWVWDGVKRGSVPFVPIFGVMSGCFFSRNLSPRVAGPVYLISSFLRKPPRN